MRRSYLMPHRHSAVRRWCRRAGSAALVLLALSAALGHAAYQVTGPTTPYTWIDISGTGTNVTPALADDSVSGVIAIGFTFNFGGTNYTQLRIGSNGWIFFGTTSTAYTNTTVATAPVTNVMMPYWDDLNPAGVAGRVKYQTLGTAPNRQFVVSYLAVPHYSASGTNTFQVVLNENGSFLFNYQNTGNQGASATIGYNFSASDRVQISFNSASIPNLRTLTWIPFPAFTHLKTVAVLSDPVSGAVNPHYIPGAVVEYALLVTNSGVGPSQDNTFSIVDPVPANTVLFSGNVSGGAPYLFTGSVAPASGLTCPFVALTNFADCIDFSSDGGTTWAYVPNGGYDPAVTHIRFRPGGRFNGDAPLGSPSPNIELRFRVQVK